MDEAFEKAFAEMKKLEGRTDAYVGKDPVGIAPLKKYAIAVDETNPLYFDEPYAAQSSYGGIVAPYTYIFENNHDLYAPMGEDGIILGHLEAAPPPFDTMIRGGNEYEIVQRLRPDDIVSFTRKIDSLTLREGKAGPMVFQINRYTYTNQRGEVLAINLETLVHTSKRKKQGDV